MKYKETLKMLRSDEFMEEELELIRDTAEKKICEIRDAHYCMENIRGILLDVFDRIDLMTSGDKSSLSFPMDIGELNEYPLEFHKQDLVLLAARPGVGKTNIALDIALNLAKSGKTIAYFTPDISRETLTSRILSKEALVPNTKVMNGQLSDNEWMSIVEAADILSKLNIYFDDTPRLTVPEMKMKVRKLGDVDLVIIDYLQSMKLRGKRNRRDFSDITRDLKIAARELNMPILLLSQLPRKYDAKKITNYSLDYYGPLETFADVVLYLKCKQRRNTESDCYIICRVAKNNYGETGEFPLKRSVF